MADHDYPRPDFVRSDLRYESLNGLWHFAFDDHDIGLEQLWHVNGIPHASRREIEVPFVFQSPASRINDRGAHEVIWYERQLEDLRTLEQRKRGEKLLLCFGAVDYDCMVYLDGVAVGGHRGGHVPFNIDISSSWSGNDTSDKKLVVRVFDSAYDLTQPRGKQYWKPEPESIWYTPSSGIWQNVWVEVVPALRIGDSNAGTVIRSNDITTGRVKAIIAVLGRRRDGGKVSVALTAKFLGTMISTTEAKELSRESDSVDLELDVKGDGNRLQHLMGNDFKMVGGLKDGLALWSPEHPHLYELTVTLRSSYGDDETVDEVTTWFGMRSLDWATGDSTVRLNGEPYFQALVLDQGYWPQSFMTPPDRVALKQDILLAKSMGFNGCRKHQKVEDPIFLHYADQLGYLVWGEMANAYAFDSRYVERFDQEWKEAVKRDINHACIVTWTPVNESWGYSDLASSKTQRDHIMSLYYMTKTLDPTRSVNDNCGWEHIYTDLSTFHDYADGPILAETCSNLETALAPKSNRQIFVGERQHMPFAPVICTEFGGVNIAPAASTDPTNQAEEEKAKTKDWGYTTAVDPADLLARLERLMLGVVEGGICCGFVYTQLTDIEQEVNGLYTFDRVPKLKAEDVRGIVERCKRIYFELLENTKRAA